MEMPMPETTTTTAQTNTEAATEVNAGSQTLLGESAPTSQNSDTSTTDSNAEAAPKVDEVKTEAKSAAPEKYEFTLPEGVTLDEESFKVVEPVLRELNLTNEDAQKLIEKYSEIQKIQSEAAEKAFNEQVEKWADDVKTDKELGGQAFEASRSAAMKAVGKFGSHELKSLLNQTGLGNHPEFVRFCVRVGKSLQEDNPITTGGTSGGAEKSIEDRLWPKQ